MSAIDPEPPAAVEPESVRPEDVMVAALERARLVNVGAGLDQTFSADTAPLTPENVTPLISQAVDAVLTQLPRAFDEVYFGRVKHLVALYAAILIEGSIFREQIDQGAVALWRGLLNDGLEALQGALGWSAGKGDGTGAAAGDSGSKSIGSVRIRSVMADYDPFYDDFREAGVI